MFNLGIEHFGNFSESTSMFLRQCDMLLTLHRDPKSSSWSQKDFCSIFQLSSLTATASSNKKWPWDPIVSKSAPLYDYLTMHRFFMNILRDFRASGNLVIDVSVKMIMGRVTKDDFLPKLWPTLYLLV